MITPALPAWLLATLVFAFTSASLTNCGSNLRSNLHLTDLYADPPSIVASDQPIKFRISFVVPNNTHINYSMIEVSMSIFSIILPSKRLSLGNFLELPLYPNEYQISYNTTFPQGTWGRIGVQMIFYNETGEELICAEWRVYATGTNKNETGWFL
jgi:hypothetical protein